MSFSTGSPPPMRGKVSASGDVTGVKRITPAYAGKSVTIRKSWKYRIGSPPPMRGKAKPDRSKQIQARITPAYAGKSPQQEDTRKNQRGSPPPMRGKGISFSGGDILCMGSPPPMRGKESLKDNPKLIIRITPAYAGKSTRNAPHHKQL